MPDVVGKRLDIATSDVERAGFGDEVDVLAGGSFGVIDESNWTVCSQEPDGDSVISVAPRNTVDRTSDADDSRSKGCRQREDLRKWSDLNADRAHNLDLTRLTQQEAPAQASAAKTGSAAGFGVSST